MVPELDFNKILNRIGCELSTDYSTSYWRSSGALSTQDLLSSFTQCYSHKNARCSIIPRTLPGTCERLFESCSNCYRELIYAMQAENRCLQDVYQIATRLRRKLRTANRIFTFQFREVKPWLLAVGACAGAFSPQDNDKIEEYKVHASWELEYAIYSILLYCIFWIAVEDAFYWSAEKPVKWDYSGSFNQRGDAFNAICLIQEGIYEGFDFSHVY